MTIGRCSGTLVAWLLGGLVGCLVGFLVGWLNLPWLVIIAYLSHFDQLVGQSLRFITLNKLMIALGISQNWELNHDYPLIHEALLTIINDEYQPLLAMINRYHQP